MFNGSSRKFDQGLRKSPMSHEEPLEEALLKADCGGRSKEIPLQDGATPTAAG